MVARKNGAHDYSRAHRPPSQHNLEGVRLRQQRFPCAAHAQDYGLPFAPASAHTARTLEGGWRVLEQMCQKAVVGSRLGLPRQQVEAGLAGAVADAVPQGQVPDERHVEVLDQSEQMERDACTSPIRMQGRSCVTSGVNFVKQATPVRSSAPPAPTRKLPGDIQGLCGKGHEGRVADDAVGVEAKDIVAIRRQLSSLVQAHGAVFRAVPPDGGPANGIDEKLANILRENFALMHRQVERY